MRLILTRHGETIENQEGIIQGHLPGRLSEKGKEQAKKLAKRLSDEKIDYIYSSDLARAADTAKEIAKHHKKVPIEFVEELREKNLGEWQGKKKTEVGLSHADSLTLIQAPGGETNQQLYERAERFLYDLLKKHRDDNVLCVGHNGIDKAIIAVITRKSAAEINTVENLHNTSVNIFEIDVEKNHKIHLFNCTKHLD